MKDKQLEVPGDGSHGVNGELGESDLGGLSSKTISRSIKLAAELVDPADTFESLECGFGRGGGVSMIAIRDLSTMEGPVGSSPGGLGRRRELVRLDDDISESVYKKVDLW